jgi:hypothetical protein
MRKHGGSGTVSALGVLIDRLEYADDAALIDRDCAQASLRVSRLCTGALHDADMEISAPKSEVMFVRPRVDTGAILPEDYKAGALTALDIKLKYVCKFCERGFVCSHGRSIHMAVHCTRAKQERARVEAGAPSEDYEVEAVIDARGSPDRRFYSVAWKGYEETTWEHRRDIEAPRCVDEFWRYCVQDRESTVEADGENRCPDCCKMYKHPWVLKAHFTLGCPMAVASRVGSKTERAVATARQVAVQDAAGVVMMGQKRLKMVFNFGYLGFRFQADGDRVPALEQRMAIARSRFAELHEIWRSKKLPTSQKLRIYACAVVSVLAYGNEVWLLTEKIKSKIKGWNARCLSVMTDREIRDETVQPSFDMLSRLRSRRLKWAGHILRMEEASLNRRVLLAQVQAELEAGSSEVGGLLMDAPAYESVEQLVELAEDKTAWAVEVLALLPASDPSRRKKGKKKEKEEGNSCGFGADGRLAQVV